MTHEILDNKVEKEPSFIEKLMESIREGIQNQQEITGLEARIELKSRQLFGIKDEKLEREMEQMKQKLRELYIRQEEIETNM